MDEIEGFLRELVDRGGCDPIVAGSVVAKVVKATAESTTRRPMTNAERQALYKARHGGVTESNESNEIVSGVTPPLSLTSLKKEKKERERGSRLPDGWHPSPTDLAFTAEKGMPAAVVPAEVEKFRLHWQGKHGPTAIKTIDRGWPAAWRTWVIRACEWKGYSPGTGPPDKPKLPEAEIHRLEEWHRRKLEKSL